MNLLAPETYEHVRRPLLEAETLPPQCYTSREFYELEVANIFMKCWNVIGRVDFLQKVGDYLTFTVVEIPVFAVKAEDGSEKIIHFIEGAPANMLVRGGLRPEEVAPGQHINTLGSPLIEDPSKFFLRLIKLDDGREFR